MLRFRSFILLSTIFLSIILPSAAFAQDNNDKLIRILQERPAGMPREEWQEQRREAVRELKRRRDKRAVPALLEIVRHERLDVLLEMAISALGELGDRRAIEPLRQLSADPSLDSYVRNEATEALRKLGATVDNRAEHSERSSTQMEELPRLDTSAAANEQPRRRYEKGYRISGDEQVWRQPGRSAVGGRKSAWTTKSLEEEKNSPSSTAISPIVPIDLSLERGLLAKSEEWKIGIDKLGYQYDGAAERKSGALGLQGKYRQYMEKEKLGYSLAGGTSSSFLMAQANTEASVWQISQMLQAAAEGRYYLISESSSSVKGGYFAQIACGLSESASWGRASANIQENSAATLSLSCGAGPGWGRVINVGALLRLRRFERALRASGLVLNGIPTEIGNKLQLIWFKQRNTIGVWQQLDYSLALLEQHGLLSTKDIGSQTAYRLIRILEDPQPNDRPAGLLFRLGYGAGRTMISQLDDYFLSFVYGGIEYDVQKDSLTSFTSKLRLFYQLANEPEVWGASLDLGYTRYLYGEQEDPLGGISTFAQLGYSDQSTSNARTAKVLLGAGYSRFFDRASRLTLSLLGGVENQAGLIMLNLEFEYGLASGHIALAK